MSSDSNRTQPPTTVVGPQGPGIPGSTPLTTTPGSTPLTTVPGGAPLTAAPGGAPLSTTPEGTSSSMTPEGAFSSTMPEGASSSTTDGGRHSSTAPTGAPPPTAPTGAPPSTAPRGAPGGPPPSTTQEGPSPPETSGGPRKKVGRPRSPSPAPPVTGKHATNRRENFLNQKSAKNKKGQSAPPLRLKDTPRKKGWLEKMREWQAGQGQEALQRAEGSWIRQPEPPSTPPSRFNNVHERDLALHHTAPRPPQPPQPPAPHAQPPGMPPVYANPAQQPQAVYPSQPHGYPQQQPFYHQPHPAYVQQQSMYGNYMPMAQPLPLVMPSPQLPPNPYPYIMPPQPQLGQIQDTTTGWNAARGAGPYQQQDAAAAFQTPRHDKTLVYRTPQRAARAKNVRYKWGDNSDMDLDKDGDDEDSEDEHPRRGRWELDDSEAWRPRHLSRGADEDVFNDYEPPEEEVMDEDQREDKRNEDEDEDEDEGEDEDEVNHNKVAEDEEVVEDVEEEEQEAEEQLMEDVEEDPNHHHDDVERYIEEEMPSRDSEGPHGEDEEMNPRRLDRQRAAVNMDRTMRETFHQAGPSREGGQASNRVSTHKGKERARTPLSGSHVRHSVPRPPPGPPPPRGGDGYIAFLFERMREMNELQREQNEYNRQWQMDMLTTVKKLDRRVSQGQAMPASVPRGRAQGNRVRVERIRPSNSMASRIVLEPQDRVLSPKQLQSLEQKEKAHLADLQNVVRVHFKKLLCVKSWKDIPQIHPPLDEDEIWTYESSGPGEFFDEDTFRVDFVQPWKEFPFNLSARDFFVRHLYDVLSGGSYKKAAIPARYVTHDHIGNALDVHMEHARKRYREEIKPPSPDEVERAKRRSRMTSRRGTLYNARFRTTQHIAKFNRFEDLFVLMSGANMSADETDREDTGARKHPTTYTITRASWMSAALRKVCRELDKENVENRDVQIGNVGTGGNGPRTRADATPPREADTRAPEGLWRDCYGTVWLAGLKDDQVRRLKIVNKDFGLSLAPIDPQSESEEE